MFLPPLAPFEPTNLIFIDTEFTSLNPATGEILSLGIVKLNGDQLYLELECSATPDAWVTKNIIPMLKETKVSVEDAKLQIQKFIGSVPPFAIAYVDNYDSLYFVKLFGAGKLPFKWLTIDFASILFAHGINPSRAIASESDAKKFYRSLGVDATKFRQHHALDDARLLREVWIKVTKP